MKRLSLFFALLFVVSACSGCATYKKWFYYDRLVRDHRVLQSKVSQDRMAADRVIYDLRMQLVEKERLLSDITQTTTQFSSFQNATNQNFDSLKVAQQRLQDSLQQELHDSQAKLEMTDRGLVVTFLAEILFDSGQAMVRTEALMTIDKVAQVINKQALGSNVAIEGHTDTDPIISSHWESNWELSVARALAVLHSFVDDARVAPNRLSAVGYGEYRPVASNATKQGKAQNRRVEIVILPELARQQFA